MKRLLSIGCVLMLGLLAGVWASANNGNRTGPVSGDQVIVSGCIIRFPPEVTGQPRIHSNGAHRCAGVDRVGISANGRMRVVQDTTDSQKYPIIQAVAQVDETLAARGIIVGPTGGNAHTEYQFYDTKLNRPLDLKKKSDRMRVAGKNSNLWVSWIHVNG